MAFEQFLNLHKNSLYPEKMVIIIILLFLKCHVILISMIGLDITRNLNQHNLILSVMLNQMIVLQ